MYTNHDTFAHRLRSFSIIFDEPYDYNNSPDIPNFNWTSRVLNDNYLVPAGAVDQRVIESTNQYQIRAVPPVRGPNNLNIRYTIFTENANGGEAIAHTECQPYEISWCGDGVVDTQFGEPCDPAAEPWRSNGLCRVNGQNCELQTTNACVPGPTTGSLTEPINSSTPGLCPAGQSVEFFTEGLNGSTAEYTWACNGSEVGVACSAFYTPNTGVACTPGTTT